LPCIVLLCLIGVYSVNASYLDLMVLVIFGYVGYILMGMGFQPAPLILAMVVVPMIETSLRQSLKMSGGNPGPLFFRPICLILYLAVLLAFVLPWGVRMLRERKTRF
jgi:putative tricarboxylic transport membrane protein